MLLTTKELLFFSSCFPFSFFPADFHYVICYNPYSQTRRGVAAVQPRDAVGRWLLQRAAYSYPKIRERKHFSQGHGCSLEPVVGVCRSAGRTALPGKAGHLLVGTASCGGEAEPKVAAAAVFAAPAVLTAPVLPCAQGFG